jgi:hypothetical protein
MIEARRMRWVGHVEWMGDRKGTYRDFIGRPEVRRPLKRN